MTTGGRASAQATLPLDDPAYLVLARLEAAGKLPPYTGGLLPLTETRVQKLRLQAGLELDPRLLLPIDGLWVAPAQEARVRLAAVHETARPYSTPIHPRLQAGAVSLSCELRLGRPCGEGVGGSLELGSAAGFSDWLVAGTRLRVTAGTDAYEPDAEVEAASIRATVGPVSLQGGRDVLLVGPSPRTQALWGANAPPLDHVLLAVAPFPLLPGDRGWLLRLSGLAFVGRLALPQTFEGPRIDMTRAQLDVANRLSLGFSHLFQLGGKGAPHFSWWEQVLEHYDRREGHRVLGAANHRLGMDMALVVPELGARLTYEIGIEDWRDQQWDAIARDIDHVWALTLEGAGWGAVRDTGLLLEVLRTGVRSHEHQLYLTGLTHGGFIVGNPLGPSSNAVFASVRGRVGTLTAAPWLEYVIQSSDTYFYERGPIYQTHDGPEENRLRAGAKLQADLAPDWRLEAQAMAEHVWTAGFVPGATRFNLAAEAVLVWRPSAAGRFSPGP